VDFERIAIDDAGLAGQVSGMGRANRSKKEQRRSFDFAQPTHLHSQVRALGFRLRCLACTLEYWGPVECQPVLDQPLSEIDAGSSAALIALRRAQLRTIEWGTKRSELCIADPMRMKARLVSVVRLRLVVRTARYTLVARRTSLRPPR
jgi:hypothetical protein